MKHFLIQPTWNCHNAGGACKYCWVDQTVRTRPDLNSPRERDAMAWIYAIYRDRPDAVDIAGGEPLLKPYVLEIMRQCPTVAFGLSTNGLMRREILRLCSMRKALPNLVSINVSYHPDARFRHKHYDKRWREAVTALFGAGFNVHTNIVDYGDNVEVTEHLRGWLQYRKIPAVVSPYERMDNLGEKLGQGLCCEGGVNHLTVAPDGSAWPCLTTLRSPYWRETCLGNWLDDTVDLSRKEQPCHLNCSDYYVLAKEHDSGDMWGVEARPCEEGQQ